tara:strand:+ start:929 stop:1621 length:693 start_codon:yes stop_codon:yes gene_type:complete
MTSLVCNDISTPFSEINNTKKNICKRLIHLVPRSEPTTTTTTTTTTSNQQLVAASGALLTRLILQLDLSKSGYFMLNTPDIVNVNDDESFKFNNVQFLLSSDFTGTVVNDGRMNVSIYKISGINGFTLASGSYTIQPGDNFINIKLDKTVTITSSTDVNLSSQFFLGFDVTNTSVTTTYLQAVSVGYGVGTNTPLTSFICSVPLVDNLQDALTCSSKINAIYPYYILSNI